jgi:hypothetical protein
MPLRTYWRWWLALIGAVFVGALGSGVWEALLRPALSSITSVLLTISTLGLASVRDDIYREAATGNREIVSLTLLSVMTGLFCGVMLGIPTALLTLLFRRRREIGNDLDQDDDRKLSKLKSKLMYTTSLLVVCFQ